MTSNVDLQPLRLLLVEDNPGDVMLFREAIKAYTIAHQLAVVSDGEAALAYVRGEPPYEDVPRPDLVLLDLNLPRIDGQAVLSALKQDERPRDDREKRDQWMVRMSRATGRNLGPFFERWGVATSEAARASVKELPEWMAEGMGK